MKKLIVGNWKMNPLTLREAENLFSQIKKGAKKASSKIVVCPPLPFLPFFRSPKGISLGAQDISFEKNGAFTGETGGSMLSSAGASYVIIGHSERRARGETSADVSKKTIAALRAGLYPIICIGEAERDNDGDFFHVIKKQLRDSLHDVQKKDISKVIVAYEPIWAVGAGSKGILDAEMILETTIFIRKVLSDLFGKPGLKAKVLYGGSVDYKNAGASMKEGGVDGLLIGRESLKPAHFLHIASSV